MDILGSVSKVQVEQEQLVARIEDAEDLENARSYLVDYVKRGGGPSPDSLTLEEFNQEMKTYERVMLEVLAKLEH